MMFHEFQVYKTTSKYSIFPFKEFDSCTVEDALTFRNLIFLDPWETPLDQDYILHIHLTPQVQEQIRNDSQMEKKPTTQLLGLFIEPNKRLTYFPRANIWTAHAISA